MTCVPDQTQDGGGPGDDRRPRPAFVASVMCDPAFVDSVICDPAFVDLVMCDFVPYYKTTMTGYIV